MVENTNPLNKYYRQPSIYISLPSKGRYYSEDVYTSTQTGEIPVLPMTAKDEMAFKTPDAMINGQATVDVIKSCCPNIKDAWGMPSIDVDSVLIAIRIATYGNSMSFDSKCPHCGEDNTHDVDLGKPLNSLQCPDYSKYMQYKDLKIKFKPQLYFTVNKSNIIKIIII